MANSSVTPAGDNSPVPFWQLRRGRPNLRLSPQDAANERVATYAADMWAETMFERIDSRAVTDAVVESAEEEFNAYERIRNLVGDSDVKWALVEPKLRMLNAKNNQRLNRRFD